MHFSSHIAAVLLAAGRSIRMGENKLLLDIGNKKIIQWTLDNILDSGVEQTVVVLGKDYEKMLWAIGERTVSIVYNPNYRQGMSTSLISGVKALSSDCEGALILLADQPNLQPDTINRFLEIFRDSNKKIVAAKSNGFIGNPVLFHRTLFPELLKIKGDVGARSVLNRFPAEVVTLDIARDEMLDIDTEHDFLKVKSLIVPSKST